METSESITCSGVQSRGDLGGTVRTREIITWERSTPNSWFDFPKETIYCQRRGCFTSTKQNEIKVSMKKNLNKTCEGPQAVLGSDAEWCSDASTSSPSPCCAQHPQAVTVPGDAVEVAAQVVSLHSWQPPHVSRSLVPRSAVSASENRQNPTERQPPAGRASRRASRRGVLPWLAAKGQVGSEMD